MKTLSLSVHQLVDFLLRGGDIDSRIFSRATMNTGSLMHSEYQSIQNKNYLSEYPLSTSIVVDEINVLIDGRADGIIKKSSKEYIIDEIKTTTAPLEEFYQNNELWHLGQAKMYGYMFSKEKKLENIRIRLTYLKQGEKKEKMVKEYLFDYFELEQFAIDLVNDYLEFYHIISLLIDERNNSIKELSFPFSSYRKGQKEFSKYVYSICNNGGTLFCEAPTGIGKTISSIYPSIKSLLLDEEKKIFYLTAKSSGKDAAYNSLNLLRDQGLKLTSIVITAKEKICINKEKNKCNPDDCPFAKGYYEKIQSIIKYALVNYRSFSYKEILDLAYQFQVCPFELELDLSLFSDVIICDYNYLFDPLSYMKRFFDEDSSHYIALVDEAHNLIDRSREMYSAEISYQSFLKAKKSMRKVSDKKAKYQIAKLTKFYASLLLNKENEYIEFMDLDTVTCNIFKRFVDVISEITSDPKHSLTDEFMDYYFEVNRFLKIYELKNKSTLLYYHYQNDEFVMRLLCLDASNYLRKTFLALKGIIYFSATLSPIDYYIDTLGGSKKMDPALTLSSPFLKENLKLIVAPNISIKYKNRDKTYEKVAEYIKTFVENKIGNYLIYLPSYEYLDNLKKYLNLNNDYNILFQNKDMSEIEKEEYISNFEAHPNKTTVGFAIIGGSFGEGIDLVSDRLIGVVIVGIGMPKINYESDKIVEYYNSKELEGKNYAYIYPGMNKVMQAIGRVIRDEKDKGSVLLIDERYALNQYRELFKKEYSDYSIVFNIDELKEELEKFNE